jgi:predicted O-linked N-acetylglucosamine transferase (SPINDLY family)
LADLFLDTFPCNAHTTASDALWVGLPVLTCSGESFASRVAASLLKAQRLKNLVCASLEEYEQKAVALAQDRKEIQRLRKKCTRAVVLNKLFNTADTTKGIEKSYALIYKRLQEREELRDLSIRISLPIQNHVHSSLYNDPSE